MALVRRGGEINRARQANIRQRPARNKQKETGRARPHRRAAHQEEAKALLERCTPCFCTANPSSAHRDHSYNRHQTPHEIITLPERSHSRQGEEAAERKPPTAGVDALN